METYKEGYYLVTAIEGNDGEEEKAVGMCYFYTKEGYWDITDMITPGLDEGHSIIVAWAELPESF